MEGNPLRNLQLSLERAQKSTSVMLAKINKFDERLAAIDEQMQPIQVTTAVYTKAKENIGLTLTEVEKTYEYFRIAQSVTASISAGLQLQNPVKQKEFVDSFARLTEAKRFFESHRQEIKSAGSALDQIEGLLKVATSSCIDEFNKLLLSCGRTVAVEGDQYLSINPLSPAVGKDVKMICDVLESNKVTAHYTAYEKCRTALVREDLSSNRTQHADAWSNLLSDIPYQRGGNPFSSLYAMALETIRGELQLWGSSFPSSVESLAVLANIALTAVDQMEEALLPFLRPISAGGSDVILQGNALVIALEDLGIFSAKFEDFRDLCKPDLRLETPASLKLIAVRDGLIDTISRSLDSLLQSSVVVGGNSSTSTAVIRRASGVGGVVLGAASSQSPTVRTDDPDNLCDLHPRTGNIINCCKELLGMGGQFRQYLALATEKKLRIPNNASSIQQLTFSLLQNLVRSLESHAELLAPSAKYKATRTMNLNMSKLFAAGDKEAEECLAFGRMHLFLINNLYSVHVFLQDRQNLPRDSDNRGAGRQSSNADNNKALGELFTVVSNRFAAARQAFCEVIASALAFSVRDLEEFDASTRRGDKSGKGRLLKAKFSLFNSGLEALVGMKGEWRITSAALRDDVSAQLVDLILTKYSEFFRASSAVPFSKKHMAQYLRFPPPTVERILRGFAGQPST